MRSYHFLLALVLPAAIAVPVQAGLIFGRHAKPDPAQRVPELIVIVKTERNENHRESAARELREYDPLANPDIVPVLVDVLEHDTAAGVRVEAAQSLGKLRPVSQAAGWALEGALKDSSIRVRLQARGSLMSYRLSGYRSDPQVAQTPTPAPPVNAQARPSVFSISALNRTSAGSVPQAPTMVNSGETSPPPLAKPGIAPAYPVGSPRPLVPADPVRLQKPPAQSNDAGPDLGPDKN